MSETTELRALLAEVRELLAGGSDASARARATVVRRTIEACAEIEDDPENRPSIVLVAMPLGEVKLDRDSLTSKIREMSHGYSPPMRNKPEGLSVILHEAEGYVPRADLALDGCLVFRAGIEQGRQLQYAVDDFCNLCKALCAEVGTEHRLHVAGRLVCVAGLGWEGDESGPRERIQRQTVPLPSREEGSRDEGVDALRRSLLDDFAFAFGLPASIWR